MFGLSYLRLGSYLAAALAVVALLWTVDQRGYKRAQTECAAEKQQLAQQTVAAFSAELDAARERIALAESNARVAAAAAAKRREALEISLRGLKHATPVAAECFPADFRVQYNAAVSAINRATLDSADDADGMPDKLLSVGADANIGAVRLSRVAVREFPGGR